MASSHSSKYLTERQYFVVNDSAYERMLSKLLSGEKMVKSYMGLCPHGSETVSCDCPYFENYLSHAVESERQKDGKINFKQTHGIVRIVNGKKKPVVPLSWLMDGTGFLF